MQSPKKQELFEKYPVPKAVWSLALPTIIGMLVMVLYNVVDTFFIGQTNAPNQVAAVSLAMPVFLILIGIGNLFGIGAGASISRYLGAKEYQKVAATSSFAFFASLSLGILFALLFIINMDSLVYLVGANEQSAPHVRDYLFYIALGAPMLILSTSMGYLVRSEGNANRTMVGMILGTLLNIVLDPIFIFVLDFGVSGAALATLISNFVSTIYFILLIIKAKNSFLSIHPSSIKLKGGIAKNVFIIGLPATFNSWLNSFAILIYNLSLVGYGNDPVAAMGIVIKVSTMYIMVFIGLATGVQPLLGYSFGAKNFDRLKKSLRYTVFASVFIGSAFFLVLYSSAELIVRAFIDNESVIAYGVQMLRIQISTAPLIGILFVVMSTMQAMGKGVLSLVLSLSRQGLSFIPSVFILNRIFGFQGLIWAQPVADIVAVSVALIILLWFLRSLSRRQAQLPKTLP